MNDRIDEWADAKITHASIEVSVKQQPVEVVWSLLHVMPAEVDWRLGMPILAIQNSLLNRE